MVDLAVVATGLALPRSQISLVNSGGTFPDPTRWDTGLFPFASARNLAYAMAVASSSRGLSETAWEATLPGDVKAPFRKAIKYLGRSNDCFVASAKSNPDWLELSRTAGPSSRIIALRQFTAESASAEAIAEALVENLRSNSDDVVLHAVETAGRLTIDDAHVVDELRSLINRRGIIAAKAMLALRSMEMVDAFATEKAAEMLASSERFSVFAALSALSSSTTQTSTASVSDAVLKQIDRSFCRSLASCDYEFIELFVDGYGRWVEDPAAHFEGLLGEQSAEHLELALDVLKQNGDRMQQAS